MSKPWTKQEIQYIEKKYLSQPVSITAKKINRSIAAVKNKAKRLGINYNRDLLSATTLAECFQISPAVVVRWIEKLELPCKIITQGKKRVFNVDLDAFWIWAKEHQDEINWSKYEHNILGIEPEWVKDAKQNCQRAKKYARWSPQEDILLQHLLRKNLTYAQIGKELDRSKSSIYHRVKILLPQVKTIPNI